MIFIEKKSNDPFFNLAAEEYALKHIADDVLMVWVNEPSLVLGKHQNAMAEVNHDFVLKENIPVIRRISGGGTVYHDDGNINISVITTVENRERMIDFGKFAHPLIQFLEGKGLNIAFYDKTNLGVNGRKFSGNAAHVYKNRVLHHGTVLFNTNLDFLDQTLSPSQARIDDKAVKSVRADIVNLHELLPENLSFNDFRSELKAHLLSYHSIADARHFTPAEKETISQLATEKYQTNEWNYGYSPAYEHGKSAHWNGHKIDLHLTVKKGIIVDLRLESEVIPALLNQKIKELFIQSPHNPQAINEKLVALRSTDPPASFFRSLLI